MECSILIDEFIRHLYCSAPSIAPERYRVWALEQLATVIDFDAAFWGSGNQTKLHFHYVEQLGLDENYVEQLEATIDINPIKEEVLNHLDEAIDMADVMGDDAFYASDVYRLLFKPYGIERILAAGHVDMTSGLYSLISLYRFDRNHRFTEDEKSLQKKLIYHLVAAVSHAYFLHLKGGGNLLDKQAAQGAALCDQEGCFHEVQPSFMSLLHDYFPGERIYGLPIPIPSGLTKASNSQSSLFIESHGLAFELIGIGNLIRVNVRVLGPMDKLTDRERQIVKLICKGLTFKEVAKSLTLAPSTISNHLYRVYDKLAISSRTELAQLVGEHV